MRAHMLGQKGCQQALRVEAPSMRGARVGELAANGHFVISLANLRHFSRARE